VETKSAVYHPAPVLLALSAGLAGANWFFWPERAAAWATELAVIGGLAVVFASVARSRSGDAIRRAIAFAGLMLAIALSLKLAAALGAAAHDDVAQRATMVVLGAFIVVTGNALPKMLTPLSVLRCDAVRAQAFHRFAGWSWVLSGLALSVAWLVLSVEVAQTVTLILLPACMLTIVWQVVRLRRSRPTTRPAA
jgi:hypothetical protein